MINFATECLTSERHYDTHNIYRLCTSFFFFNFCSFFDTGCNLGSSFYKLGEKFNPTLIPGEPSVCIICQCVPVSHCYVILIITKY